MIFETGISPDMPDLEIQFLPFVFLFFCFLFFVFGAGGARRGEVMQWCDWSNYLVTLEGLVCYAKEFSLVWYILCNDLSPPLADIVLFSLSFSGFLSKFLKCLY